MLRSLTFVILAIGIILSCYFTKIAKLSLFVQFRAFTFYSNFLGLISTALGTATFFGKSLQLTAFLALATTAIVYHTMLQKFAEFSNMIGRYLNSIQHAIGPALFGTWFFLSRNFEISLTMILVAVLIPNIWLLYTLYRESKGLESGYPFLNIKTLGLRKVVTVVGAINLVNLGVALALTLV